MRSFTTKIIRDIVSFLSTEHHPTLVFVVTDLNFSLQSNEAKIVCHSSPCIDKLIERKSYDKFILFVEINRIQLGGF